MMMMLIMSILMIIERLRIIDESLITYLYHSVFFDLLYVNVFSSHSDLGSVFLGTTHGLPSELQI